MRFGGWLALLLAAGFAGATAAATIDHTLATRWLPDGYGYDWSRAGYAGGKGSPPNPSKLFNVKNYGAKGNGRSLDDTAVQAALKAVLKSSSGGLLYFPAGTYVLSKPLYANASNIVVRGAGREATRLLFTRSLSQVYGIQWGVDNCTGDPTGLWTNGGAMVVLSGMDRERSAPAKVLANVKVPAGTVLEPGSRRLQVDSSSGLITGQWVRLVIDDTSTADDPVAECDYRKDLYGVGGAGGAAVAAAAAAGGPVLSVQTMPAHVAADPIVALAAASKAAAGADESVSVAEAAALDARQTAGQVAAAMAKPGTVAAWLFGENLADSGGPGAINSGSLSFAFKVQRKGSGWIEADRDILYAVKPGWKALLLDYNPGISKSGVEHLTISFNSSGRYEGHFSDRGYNAVQLAGARDCWVASVRIENADNAVLLYNASFTTLSDIVLSSKDRTWSDAQNVNGHHGISLSYGQNVLVTRFNIGARMWHDLHVQAACKLAVLSNGSGVDLNIDNHRAGPHANLFSNLDFGANTRPFKSGGRKDRGAQTGRGSVFWNLRAGPGASSASIKLPKCDYGGLLAFVLKQRSGSSCSESRWKVSTWTSSKPADLHGAQVTLRRSLES